MYDISYIPILSLTLGWGNGFYHLPKPRNRPFKAAWRAFAGRRKVRRRQAAAVTIQKAPVMAVEG